MVQYLRHHRARARLEAGLGAEVLGRVAFRAAGLAGVVQRSALHRHQVRRFQLHPALRERMLDALVLTDRPIEHDALARVARRARERVLPDPDRFESDQRALRVQAVQQIAKTLAFLADAILERHRQAVDEDLVRVDRLAPHLVDHPHVAVRTVQVGVEQRQPVGGALALLGRRGAREQHDLRRFLRSGGPHLAPVHDVAVAAALGARADPRRVQPGIGLGDAEAGEHPALDQIGQPARALLLAAEHHDRMRAEDVDVDRRARAHCAGTARHAVHQQSGLGHAEPGAAIRLGHRDAEIARLGNRTVELERKLAGPVVVQPVGILETRAQAVHVLDDGALIFGQ